MKNVGVMMLLAMVVSACRDSEEKVVSQLAKEFTEAYYNQDLRKAKGYCHQDLYPIMNFRISNLTDRDRAFQKAAGKVKVKVVDCQFDTDDDIAYVDVEVSNFLRINYMTDSLSIVPCDTMEVILVNPYGKNWYVNSLF